MPSRNHRCTKPTLERTDAAGKWQDANNEKVYIRFSNDVEDRASLSLWPRAGHVNGARRASPQVTLRHRKIDVSSGIIRGAAALREADGRGGQHSSWRALFLFTERSYTPGIDTIPQRHERPGSFRTLTCFVWDNGAIARQRPTRKRPTLSLSITVTGIKFIDSLSIAPQLIQRSQNAKGQDIKLKLRLRSSSQTVAIMAMQSEPPLSTMRG